MKFFLTVLSIFFVIVTSQAKYTQTCKAKYKKNNGWSDYYNVNVTFMTGSELNNATSSFDYDGFSTYAMIFWDQDEASVIKISSLTLCGTEVEQSCITNNVTNLVGNDQQGRKWEVCTKSLCF